LTFEEDMSTSSRRTKSRIVLALDLEDPDPQALLYKSLKILDEVKEYICALKLNRQLLLTLGLKTVSNIVSRAHEYSLPTIMDAKLNDVAHTNAFMMRSFIQSGFDAVIASPVSGWEGGLDSVFSLAREHDRGILLLVYMSNPGAEQFYSKTFGNSKLMFEYFSELALQWKAQGLVVAGTRPEIIRQVRTIVGPELAIYSPGIGAQGGDAKRASDAGATYLIVGRAIYASLTPSQAANTINQATTRHD
jgi:orotidine-5'-phosphate decarboxylase